MNSLIQFQVARDIFRKEVRERDLMCQVITVLEPAGSPDHNCIACNLDEHTAHIIDLLNALAESEYMTTQCKFEVLMYRLNSLFETIMDIHALFGKKPYDNYPSFKIVRAWANFFKHPREFSYLVHFPAFLFESDFPEGPPRDGDASLVINTRFVQIYWNGEKWRQTDLPGALTDKGEDVLVLMPEVGDLIKNCCNELRKFVDLVLYDPRIQSILSQKGAIKNFRFEPKYYLD